MSGDLIANNNRFYSAKNSCKLIGDRFKITNVENKQNIVVTFEEKYPNISAWVLDGQIEVGYGEYDDVFVRAIDAGGVAWESNARFSSMDEALSALDEGIAAWCDEIGLDLDLDLRLKDFRN